MSPTSIIALARDAGIRIGIDGADLVLDAPAEPSQELLELVRRFKPEIIRCLRGQSACTQWSAEEWQAFFDERAGIVEFDGGATRAEAETQAYRCCVAEWMNQHPVQSAPGSCLHCGVEARAGSLVVPFGCSATGRVWVHAACWPEWHARRQREAVEFLAKVGIHPPQMQDGGGR